eukprot:10316532-Alexandrium_andersonii.AAC.1
MLPCLRSVPLLGQLIYYILRDIHRMVAARKFLTFKSTPRLTGTLHTYCAAWRRWLSLLPPHPVDRPPVDGHPHAPLLQGAFPLHAHPRALLRERAGCMP